MATLTPEELARTSRNLDLLDSIHDKLPGMFAQVREIQARLEASIATPLFGGALHMLGGHSKGTETWLSVVDQIGHGLQKTLSKYQDFYRFLNKFTRFLRVRISYTALLKNSKNFIKKAKDDHELTIRWQSIREP